MTNRDSNTTPTLHIDPATGFRGMRVIVTFRGERMVSVVSRYADPLLLRLSLFNSFHHTGLRLEDIVVDCDNGKEHPP